MSKRKYKYLGGITSYSNVVLLNNFIFTFNPNLDTMSIDRESLLLSVREFLSKLDEKETYSVLFVGKSSNGENISHTISKSSIIIHKEFYESGLTEIWLNDINRYFNTYLSHISSSEINFNLIAQFKIWVSEEEYGKDKFMEIKRVIVEDGLQKLKLLTSLNKINSDDDVIIKGLKNLKFYDLNLSYNHWFEKELFFNSLGGNYKGIKIYNNNNNNNNNNIKNLQFNIKDIINLYNEFWILLKNNKDVVYYLDDKYNYNDNDKLKIMFRNIVRGNNNKINNNNDMVNNWIEYKNTNNNNRFIREVIIYRNDIDNPLIKWIDFICLDDKLGVLNADKDSIKVIIIN